MSKHRGLYGQSEGNETSSTGLQEYLSDSEIVEGPYVATLRRMVRSQDWAGVSRLTARLKSEGHTDHRIQSMLSVAMKGVRL